MITTESTMNTTHALQEKLESKPYTDWDADGCKDLTEDSDDDNDQVNDTADDCWRGLSNWVSNSEFDYDGDGCNDLAEDDDDDNDGVTMIIKQELFWTNALELP